jgi:hypothetical protein
MIICLNSSIPLAIVENKSKKTSLPKSFEMPMISFRRSPAIARKPNA